MNLRIRALARIQKLGVSLVDEPPPLTLATRVGSRCLKRVVGVISPMENMYVMTILARNV